MRRDARNNLVVLRCASREPPGLRRDPRDKTAGITKEHERVGAVVFARSVLE